MEVTYMSRVTLAIPFGLMPSTARAVPCNPCADSHTRQVKTHAGLPSTDAEPSSTAQTTAQTTSRRIGLIQSQERLSRSLVRPTTPVTDHSVSQSSDNAQALLTARGES